MTQDTNTTLTEDGIKKILEKIIHFEDSGSMDFHFYTRTGDDSKCVVPNWQFRDTNDFHDFKMLILTALDQYPKLKIFNEELKKPSCSYCGKKLKLSDFQIDIGTGGNTYTRCDCGIEENLQQENNQLKQLGKLYLRVKQEELVQYVYDLPKSKTHSEASMLEGKIEITKKEIESIQQLLKGDST